MDFKQFDSRELAETGARMQILHQYSREPIEGAFVLVRGVASPSIVTAQRALAQSRMRTRKSNAVDEMERIMEDSHNEMIDGAMPFVMGFEGVEYGNKTLNVEDARQFLNFTYPDMTILKDEDGDPIMEDGKDKKGNHIMIPKFKMLNLPYAKQVTEFAAEHFRFLESDGKR